MIPYKVTRQIQKVEHCAERKKALLYKKKYEGHRVQIES